MMISDWLFLLVALTILPPLVVGIIRKTKARLQNRIGSPFYQPVFDLVKLFKKNETVSTTTSWIFRFSAAANVAIVLYLAVTAPWIGSKLHLGSCDLFLLLYLFGAMRLCTLLAAMDAASPFGAFAASREATLSFLVEPASMLSLAALALTAQSSDLNVIFAATDNRHTILWLLSGSAFLLASLVELSRMPIDDPTTHLELTMVHEALIIEASGKNLALLEYANALKLCILLGLSSQCFLHAVPSVYSLNAASQALASTGALMIVAIFLGIFESTAVKLNWRKAPEFIAYALTLSFMASIVAVGANAV